jgi:hypothetical protein
VHPTRHTTHPAENEATRFIDDVQGIDQRHLIRSLLPPPPLLRLLLLLLLLLSAALPAAGARLHPWCGEDVARSLLLRRRAEQRPR